MKFYFLIILFWVIIDDAARQALDWGLMELQEFLEDEELALGVKGEGPGILQLRTDFSIFRKIFFFPPVSYQPTIFDPIKKFEI